MKRKIIALADGRSARQGPDDPLPLTLGHFVLAHPEALSQRHINLRFIGPPVRLIGRAAHPEAARRAPAKGQAVDRALLSGP
jgi:hypothetical protein